MQELDGGDRDGIAAAMAAAERPVAIRGLASAWPAVAAAWEGDEAIASYLSARDIGRPLTVLVAPPEVGGRYFYDDAMRGFNFGTAKMPMRELLARLLAERGQDDVQGLYAGSNPTLASVGTFAAENPLDIDTQGVDPRIWVGNASRIAPHYDMAANIAVVVAGKRRFTLFPPEQLANLYVGPVERTVAGQPTSMVDPDNPDLDRFPRFAEAQRHAQVAELGLGDAIYIPPLWWHHVRAEAALNVLVNYWFAQPQDRFPFAALMLALHSIRDLPEPERRAWRAWFDHYVFGEDASDAAAHLPAHARGVLGPPSPARDAMMTSYVAGMIRGGGR
ncbi:cupin-like domain-containing protein [Sphingomonas koreensis]|uniref:Cupin-like domain-containing protein n=1 Tax=Sphingomonas koreensis TaxID=93064 RepID=A0A2M8WBW6_9SPHN|nr:cupin-like domain-containing protein [Sphingomonas koreensis]PJI88362.1 Cupin-like domain-containing protein [Sphingomonas koreensis]RSU58709.1 cupin-like domain-containing protein [Sphingomonas koreensis]RSU66875.1 cupin-like domain-containing protein [Sphingomonas koreensis]RSY85870.1 cupin-like domain-containing protein [Sphingomonas koreensis]